jgi:TorA maturation chaperone TorD
MNAEAIKKLALRANRRTEKHDVNKDYVDLFVGNKANNTSFG